MKPKRRISVFNLGRSVSFTDVFDQFHVEVGSATRQQRRRLRFQRVFAQITQKFDLPRSERRSIARSRIKRGLTGVAITNLSAKEIGAAMGGERTEATK